MGRETVRLSFNDRAGERPEETHSGWDRKLGGKSRENKSTRL